MTDKPCGRLATSRIANTIYSIYDMTREEIFNRIAKQVGKLPISCNCEKCKQMCQRTPCLGTPHDILALRHTRRPIPMVQLKSTGSKVDGCCICYHDGKCELHENGLKPTEGKLSNHDVSERELLPQYNLTFQVASEWMKEENFPIINQIVYKLSEYWDKKERNNG